MSYPRSSLATPSADSPATPLSTAPAAASVMVAPFFSSTNPCWPTSLASPGSPAPGCQPETMMPVWPGSKVKGTTKMGCAAKANAAKPSDNIPRQASVRIKNEFPFLCATRAKVIKQVSNGFTHLRVWNMVLLLLRLIFCLVTHLLTRQRVAVRERLPVRYEEARDR